MKTENQTNHFLLTTEQLAKQYKVHPQTIREWARGGVIPVYRIGHRCVRFHLDECNLFLKQTFEHGPNRHSKKQKADALYDLECRLVEDACAKLKKAGITFETEVKIGSAVRADIVGRNWVCEAKINCSSTSMISAIAQALIYKKNLNKRFVCLLLPSDQEPSEFFKKECNDFGIDLVSEATLTDWVRQKQNEA